MFGFGDKDTPETARGLFLRSQEIAIRYLPLPWVDLIERVERDFPEPLRWASSDQVTLHYEELPDFSFNVNSNYADALTLTVFGGGRFAGFMLQRGLDGDHLHIDVKKPLSGPMGPKTNRLASIFQSVYGATNPRETVERMIRR